MLSMSEVSTKDCSAIAGVLPPLFFYLFFIQILQIIIKKIENMLKLKYILFVYGINMRI